MYVRMLRYVPLYVMYVMYAGMLRDLRMHVVYECNVGILCRYV